MTAPMRPSLTALHRGISAACGAIFCLAAIVSSAAQASEPYPTKTVRVVIPYSAGGAPDVLFRLVGRELSEKWGQQVVIENKAGGNTIIGATDVIRSAPDGYTLLFTADQTFLLNPIYYKTLAYDVADLAPISLIATAPHIFAVPKSLPVNSVSDYVAWARKNPEKASYGATGSMSLQKLAMEMFAKLSDVKLISVPYRGAAETTTDLVSGQISSTINGVAVLLPHIQSGALKALAITADGRSPILPDLPTVRELGMPNFKSQGIFGLFGPSRMPAEIRKKIHADVKEAISKPGVKDFLEKQGFVLRGDDGDEFQKVIASEIKTWRATMSDLGFEQQ